MNRLYNLDYLRGLAAFGIMIYHYLLWTLGVFSADTFMGRLGIYGVSIFYILSGLTLYHVYFNKMSFSKEDIGSFFRKRIFRIFPLLWLTTIVAVILSKKTPDFTDLFLNLSGLFGFIKWDTYFSTGVWSIGNELVFYVFFPFFILFTKKIRPLMLLLALALFGLFLYFTFFALTTTSPLSEQWSTYINPLNQVFLFLGGFFIGFFLQRVKMTNALAVALIGTALVVFIFYPATGDVITIVTGINRLIFTSCGFLICIGFYKVSIKIPAGIHTPLALLGEASYSIYLLHPIVYNLVRFTSKNLFHFPDPIRLAISVASTLVISYFVYQHFEKFFMKWGRSKAVVPA
jgi:exopolysaccharide production protein ExoZ